MLSYRPYSVFRTTYKFTFLLKLVAMSPSYRYRILIAACILDFSSSRVVPILFSRALEHRKLLLKAQQEIN